MLGVLVQILITWLILWFYNKENPLVLGLRLSKTHAKQFIYGFLITALFSLLYYAWYTIESGISWSANPFYGIAKAFDGITWTLTSVLFEELIFRGVLLYILIKEIGEWKAITISAVSFGVYHWFSYGVLGNPIQMMFVFFVTGLYGWIFAYAFAKTKSLYMPIAIHFATNLITIVVFSKGPIGSQLLLANGGTEIEGWTSLAVFLFQNIPVPISIYFLLKSKKLNS